MGVYRNNKIIMQKEKEEQDELDKAQMMLEIADKEVEIQNLTLENANILLEIAMAKEAL